MGSVWILTTLGLLLAGTMTETSADETKGMVIYLAPTLFDEFQNTGTNTGGIDAGQKLIRTNLRNRNIPHKKVFKPFAFGNQCLHALWNVIIC